MRLSVYLAAHFPRRLEIRAHADELESRGIKVTSGWLYERGNIPDDPTGWTINALGDVQDVKDSNCFVMFTGSGTNGAPSVGGRTHPQGAHTELGIAFILGHWIMLVGEKTQIFHHLPGVNNYETWVEVRDLLIQKNKEEVKQ